MNNIKYLKGQGGTKIIEIDNNLLLHKVVDGGRRIVGHGIGNGIVISDLRQEQVNKIVDEFDRKSFLLGTDISEVVACILSMDGISEVKEKPANLN
ncbi:MAG: hypothetical protein PHN31_05105 [Candidatus Gracilibacteria bacterium]|nr:hypothetical protein [Candidatus Gracilibacteria bacterium]